MPFYDVQHTLSLSEQQEERLADAIATIHTSLFTTPKLFVNVAFTDVSNRQIFAAGKRVSCFLFAICLACERFKNLFFTSPAPSEL